MSSNVVKMPERENESAGSAVSDFVRDHPGWVVAGGVALGLVAGSLVARGSTRKLARRALTLAELAGAAGLALGKDAVDRAGEAGGSLRERGEAFIDRASGVLRERSDALADKAGKLAEPAEETVDAAGEAAQRLLRKAVELAGRLRG
jgi:ElaB/YqjD/DUF883 family membrane-anchored ribosome-binding protein